MASRNIRAHLMFLSFLIWLMNINHYVPQGSDLVEEHKDPPYVPQLPDLTDEHKDPPYVPWAVDVHKLCTSVFKPSNVFLDMNIGPEEHKKVEK
jgi:hypothetical protein